MSSSRRNGHVGRSSATGNPGLDPGVGHSARRKADAPIAVLHLLAPGRADDAGVSRLLPHSARLRRHRILLGLQYQLLPAFSGRGYTDTFEGCIAQLPDLCTIGKTYLKTLKLCFLVWAITLFIGFWVAYFLAFHVRSKTWQMGLSLLCTIPFWTSNVIRMIAWIPLLGRNGLVNSGLMKTGLINHPIEWLLFSEFSVVLALVHLFTFFMVVPIFNSMVRIDKSLIEAAYDAGATGFQTLVNVIIPLSKPGIVIGSIFVITIVMGDFITIGVMGGQQIAAAGKIIETRVNALQFPAAAANAVILLVITFLIITMMSRIVDIKKEL